MPGRHINDTQMRLFMKYTRTSSVESAAAVAGFSASTGYRIKHDPQLPSQNKAPRKRLSRHWHELARMDETGIAASALGDRELGYAIARHKAIFFSQNDAGGHRIDYAQTVSGGLQLVPSGTAHAVLADDYARMQATACCSTRASHSMF